MRTSTKLLLFALAGAGALWYLARRGTDSGATGDVLEGVIVTAKKAGQAVKDALMPRGYRNNNPGNIRFLSSKPWNGQVDNDGGYGIYSSPQLGTRALARQLLKYATQGATTVRDIINRWAPPEENDTSSYVAHVAKFLGVSPDESLNVQASLPEIAKAIALHENGYIDANYDFDTWVFT